MATFDSKPALVQPLTVEKQLAPQEWVNFIGRQIGAARCFGITLETEMALRDGYRGMMEQAGVRVTDRMPISIAAERGSLGLREEGNEYFDTRKLGEGHVLSVDALKFFVGEVAPALGWKEQVDAAAIGVETVEDVNRMIEMARVLGLSRYDEEQVYQFLQGQIKAGGGELPDRDYEKILGERKKVGLEDGEGVVDSMRSGKLFNAVEVAAFVNRVIPKADKVVVM